MPIWLTILLQVVESVLTHVIQNPPAPSAPQVEHDAHAANVAKVQAALDVLKA